MTARRSRPAARLHHLRRRQAHRQLRQHSGALRRSGYIIVACVIIALNIGQLPGVILLIWKSAFGMESRLRCHSGPGHHVGRQARRILQRSRPGHGSARLLRRRGEPPGQAGSGAGVLRLHRHPVRLLRHRLHAAHHRPVQRAGVRTVPPSTPASPAWPPARAMCRPPWRA